MVIGGIGEWSREPSEQQWAWLRTTIRQWLARLDVELGYTSLEPGAGMLFGNVFYAASIPFRVILPAGFQMEEIPPHLRNQFTKLLKQAVAVRYVAPLPAPFVGWQTARLQVINKSNLIFSMVGSPITKGMPFYTLYEEACEAGCTVIQLELNTMQGKIICNTNQLS